MTDLTQHEPAVLRVATPWGAFPAVESDGVVRIRNIRYARADRFAPPQPVEPDADESADLQFTTIACPQPPSLAAAVLGDPLDGAVFDEDCLRVSITRPADADEPLPVMVWIHGGAYASNAGDIPGTDGSALAREQRVIVVTVTYRLGLLGWVGDGARRGANLGLLDIIEALRWVRERIGGFGGDPDRVTVFGQSAGADAIAHVLAADGTEGLVTRAIIQSAPFGIRERRDAMHERMLRAVGDLDADAPIDDLFAAQARARAASAGFGLRSGMPFCTQYGHAPLPAEPEIVDVWRRRAPGLELLVTRTTEETMFYLDQMPRMQALFGRPVIGPIARRVIVAATTNGVYRSGARRFARLMAGAGASVHEGVFDARPEGSGLGAAHAIEVPLLFPNEQAWSRAALVAPHGADSLVAAGTPLRAAWAEFARTGRVDVERIGFEAGWRGALQIRRRG
ncbi:carboxylesterase family protein [Agromyces sp. H66]|uniref:carboxylesterase family protein n=1 Tax=Agromyces sp. H66 TaxID=2529859 RepID=UPI0020BFC55D|nr:carboxylesterase family protein [Agromyces sp. H66]